MCSSHITLYTTYMTDIRQPSFTSINTFFIIFLLHHYYLFFFFFNDTAPTEISPLPLHDPLPISSLPPLISRTRRPPQKPIPSKAVTLGAAKNLSSTKTAMADACKARSSILPVTIPQGDRKSTRLNSSHSQISYAVFCLKKKKKQT